MIEKYISKLLLSTALASYAPRSFSYQNFEDFKLENNIRILAEIAAHCSIPRVTSYYIFFTYEYILPEDVNQRPSFIFQERGTTGMGIDGKLGAGDQITILFRNGQSITTNGKKGFSGYWDHQTWQEIKKALGEIVENLSSPCKE